MRPKRAGTHNGFASIDISYLPDVYSFGSPHILVKPLVFNTSSGYTHIEFSAVKQDSCSVTFEVMKPSC